MQNTKFSYWVFVISMSIFCACQKNNKQNETISLDSSDVKMRSKEKHIKSKASGIATKNDSECKYELNMISQGLVNIKEVDPTILVELKYSTTDNFVEKDVYGCLSACYLQRKAANMLAVASKNLKKENDSLRLLVYDGARPHTIQKILWESLPQYPPNLRENYVANPAKGSIHNYGSAVDLTISNQNGNPIDMGTKFDFFGELAYPKLENKLLAEGKLTAMQIQNRKLLRRVMQNAGFMPIEFEWWHFNAVSRENAKLMYQIVN